MITEDQAKRIQNQSLSAQARIAELVQQDSRFAKLMLGISHITSGLQQLADTLNPLGMSQVNELAARGDWHNANIKGQQLADEAGLGVLRKELRRLTDEYIRMYDPKLADQLAAIDNEISDNAA